MRKKLYFILSLSIIIVILVTGCGNKEIIKPEVPKITKDLNLKIMTTNYLLYGIVKDIVKDKNDVDFMFKDEQQQWDYNFTEDSVNNISKKDIFFYTGGDFEPWSGDFVSSLSKNKVVILNVSRGLKIISRDEPLQYNYKNKVTEVKDNPYYWLDIDKYKTAIFNIVRTIEDKDSINKKYYEDNYHAQLNNVDLYDKKLKEIYKGLKNYTFVVQGDKLDYFTKYMGFKVVKLPTDFSFSDTENDINVKIEEKLMKTDKIIFLYSNNTEVNENQSLISKYNMKSSKINVYQYKTSYLDILRENCDSLEKWVILDSNG
ncbi:MAG: metal ABC transporter substrate-binding protein [Clostridiaceae bacterium]|nr:metal ABC transporter substrate-binding protein [Clostridiaceae bacterium]